VANQNDGLSDRLVDAYWVHAREHEGSVPYLYVDTVGKVTIGVGRMIGSEADLKSFYATHNTALVHAPGATAACTVIRGVKTERGPIGKSGSPVTEADFIEAFRHMTSLGAKLLETAAAAGVDSKKKAATAKSQEGCTDIRLSDNAARAEFARKLREMFRDLTKATASANVGGAMQKHNPYAEFDAFPEPAQIAILDLMYNLGAAGLRTKWPTFTKAVKDRRWKDAAAAANRPQLSSERNKWVRGLLERAAAEEKAQACLVDPPPTAMTFVPEERKHKSKFEELLNVWKQREQNACPVETSRDALLKQRGVRSAPGTLPRVIP
jgi:GH24 family phage-related lysozyme (muramidase)